MKPLARTRARVANRILNCLPSVGTETDWSFGSGLMAGVAETILPPAVDLRDNWWAIGDQGQTGSCVGWATADSVLRWHLVRANRVNPAARLSVRFIWMAAKELDEITAAPTTFIEPEGTTLKAALDVARKYGVVLDGDLPFKGGLFPGAAQIFYARAAQLKIASYFNLGTNPTSWRRWLANNGPILTRLNVDETWNRPAPGGVLQAYRPETALGGHAVALVGYNPAGFIVRNSWGKSWGDGGFAYASNAYAAAAFTEAYGVTLGGANAMPNPLTEAAAEAAAVGGPPPIAEIERVVKRTADRITGRNIPLGEYVSRWFPDLKAVDRLLAAIQDELTAGLVLTGRPTEERLKLLKGSLLDLADWVLRTQNAAGAES